MTPAKPISPRSHLETVLAYLFLFVLLMKLPSLTLVPASVFLGIAMLPVVWGRIREYRLLRWLMLGAPLAIVTGLITQLFVVPQSGQSAGLLTMAQMAVWILGFPMIIGIGLWALDRVPLRAGLTTVVVGVLVESAALGNGFEWKGTEGIYVTALLLAVFAKSRVVTFLVLLMSIGVSAVSDARFMSVVGVLTLLVWFITRRTRVDPHRHRRGTVRVLVAIAAASVASIWAMTAGLMGRAIQYRTLDQLSHPAFIVADARVEWAATIALFQRVPSGFGLGAVPSPALQLQGIDAVQVAGGDYTSPYFTQEVFGKRVDLHSMLADLWFHFGVGGVFVAVVIAMILIGGLSAMAAARSRIGLLGVYMALIGVWDLLFSPLANSDRLIFGLLCVCGVLYSRGLGVAGGGDAKTDAALSAGDEVRIAARPVPAPGPAPAPAPAPAPSPGRVPAVRSALTPGRPASRSL